MKLEVYSQRWEHTDKYTVELTEDGWRITHKAISGHCDTTGEPYLFQNLRQDLISYPADLGGYMDFLWHKAKDENISEGEVQQSLDELGTWIQTTEKSTPGGIFAEYR